ncbi:MAG: hypothetical protein HS126_34220 [Anaerolineales bacterium]|nr:hypothetical protein [Anaerolineales bacterium]
MSEYKSPDVFQQALRFERLRASFMSLICGLVFLCALVAATRIPDYLAAPDYLRLIGVFLFILLALAGLVANIYHHRCLQRLAAAKNPANEGRSTKHQKLRDWV